MTLYSLFQAGETNEVGAMHSFRNEELPHGKRLDCASHEWHLASEAFPGWKRLVDANERPIGRVMKKAVSDYLRSPERRREICPSLVAHKGVLVDLRRPWRGSRG